MGISSNPLLPNCFRKAAYLVAITIAEVRVETLSCVIPSLPVVKFSKAAPNMRVGSVKELSYSPSSVISPVRFNKFSFLIR